MSQLLDRQFVINNVMDRIEALERKLRDVGNGLVLEVHPDEDPGDMPLNLTEGPDIDVVGARIGRGGDRILVFKANGDPLAEHSTLAGAIAEAITGDTIVLPSQTITLTAGVTLGAGVALVGMSDKSIISASGFSGTAITMAAGAVCYGFSLAYVSNGATAVGIDASYARALVRDVRVTVSGGATTNIGILSGANVAAVSAHFAVAITANYIGRSLDFYTASPATDVHWEDISTGLPVGCTMYNLQIGGLEGWLIVVDAGSYDLYYCANLTAATPAWSLVMTTATARTYPGIFGGHGNKSIAVTSAGVCYLAAKRDPVTTDVYFWRCVAGAVAGYEFVNMAPYTGSCQGDSQSNAACDDGIDVYLSCDYGTLWISPTLNTGASVGGIAEFFAISSGHGNDGGDIRTLAGALAWTGGRHLAQMTEMGGHTFWIRNADGFLMIDGAVQAVPNDSDGGTGVFSVGPVAAGSDRFAFGTGGYTEILWVAISAAAANSKRSIAYTSDGGANWETRDGNWAAVFGAWEGGTTSTIRTSYVASDSKISPDSPIIWGCKVNATGTSSSGVKVNTSGTAALFFNTLSGDTYDVNHIGTVAFVHANQYVHTLVNGTLTYLQGDRAAYAVEDWHASDIEGAAPTRHTPLPGNDGELLQADSGIWASAPFDWDVIGAAAGADMAHTHASAGEGGKLAQANTHESPDTDAATSSLHHTIGPSGTQAAAGNHTHAGGGGTAADVSTDTDLFDNILTIYDDDVQKALDTLDDHTHPGGSAHTIQNEEVPYTARTNLNFEGAGVGVSDDPGNDATVVTIPGGGGGVTFEVVGYNTAGGSTENMTIDMCYAKQVTLANNAALYSIDAYLNQDSDNVHGIMAAVFTDAAGTPGRLIAASPAPNGTISFILNASSGGSYAARWFSIPITAYLAAGTYWIAIMRTGGAGNLLLAYDVGTDRIYTAGGVWFADWGRYTPTTTARQYSIRAQLIR